MSQEATRFSLAPAAVPSDRELEAVEDLAEAAGFVDRPVLKAPPRRKRFKGQVHNFTMRVFIDDAEAFVAYAERERITYREAFARMLKPMVAK
jgi:hypothetical protein